MSKREVSLFERETVICYCSGSGGLSCQPCRDRRKAKGSTTTYTFTKVPFPQQESSTQKDKPQGLHPDPTQQKMWEEMTRYSQASKRFAWWKEDLKDLPSPRKMTATEARERAQQYAEFRRLFEASLPDMRAWQKDIEALTGIGQIHDSIIVDTAYKPNGFEQKVTDWLRTGENPNHQKARDWFAKEYQQQPAKPTKRHNAEREEGGQCIWRDCSGHYNVEYKGEGGCSCFRTAPCGYCTSSYLVCNKCGDEEGEEEVHA